MRGLAYLGFGLWLLGCASSAAPAKDARGELVIDEGLRVEGRPDGGRTRVGELVLPALPQPLEQCSPAFQQGFRLALELLAAPGPTPPTAAGATDYRTWAETAFRAWLVTRSGALERAQGVLNELSQGPAAEQVPAAALLALMFEHTVNQFATTAPPPNVQGDAMLALSYRVGLDGVGAPWLLAAHQAFQYCAQRAVRETDAAFGLWLELCHSHDAALEQSLNAAEARAAQLAAMREAERLEAAGPPPAGPEVCWKPNPGLPPPVVPAGGRAPRLGILLSPVPGERITLSLAQQRTLHAALRARLAPELEALGAQHDWLGDAELDAALAAQTERRLVPGGARCQAPSPLVRVLQAGAGPLHLLRARVICAAPDSDCHALLGFDPPLPEAPGLSWTAPLATPSESLESWQHAVAELAALEGRVSDWDDPGAGSERDRRYGGRDAESGVRVSVSVKDETPTMDARPLSEAPLRAALGRCLKQHLKPDAVETTAVHTTLQVSAEGKVQSLSLEAEPSSEAKAPTPALDKCLKAALKTAAFPCSPDGRPTQTSALICLRPDAAAPTPPPNAQAAP
jgi:hypothetical protein